MDGCRRGGTYGVRTAKRDGDKLPSGRWVWTGQPALVLRRATDLVRKYKGDVRRQKRGEIVETETRTHPNVAASTVGGGKRGQLL